MPDEIKNALEAGDKEKLIATWRDRVVAACKNRDALIAVKGDMEASPLIEKSKEKIRAQIKAWLTDFDAGIVPEPDVLPSEPIAGRVMTAASQNIEGTKVVGHIVAFRLNHTLVPNEFIRDYWEAHRLEKWMKPVEAHEVDAYAKACQNLDFIRDLTDGKREHCKVEKLKKSTTREYGVYRVLGEVKKGVESKISQDNVVIISLHDNIIDGKVEGREVRFRRECGDSDEHLNDLFDLIVSRMTSEFKIYREHTTEKQIRDRLRYTIEKHCAGINFTMSHGGAYFVPLAFARTIRQYKDFIKAVNEAFGEGEQNHLVIRTIKMIDDMDTKDMIEEDVKAHVKEEVERVLKGALTELKCATAPESIERTLAAYLAQHKETADMVETYEGLLEREIRIELGEDIKQQLSQVERETQVGGRVRDMLQMIKAITIEGMT